MSDSKAAPMITKRRPGFTAECVLPGGLTLRFFREDFFDSEDPLPAVDKFVATRLVRRTTFGHVLLHEAEDGTSLHLTDGGDSGFDFTVSGRDDVVRAKGVLVEIYKEFKDWLPSSATATP